MRRGTDAAITSAVKEDSAVSGGMPARRSLSEAEAREYLGVTVTRWRALKSQGLVFSLPFLGTYSVKFLDSLLDEAEKTSQEAEKAVWCTTGRRALGVKTHGNSTGDKGQAETPEPLDHDSKGRAGAAGQTVDLWANRSGGNGEGTGNAGRSPATYPRPSKV